MCCTGKGTQALELAQQTRPPLDLHLNALNLAPTLSGDSLVHISFLDVHLSYEISNHILSSTSKAMRVFQKSCNAFMPLSHIHPDITWSHLSYGLLGEMGISLQF